MTFEISARTEIELYGMRGTRTRPSDRVEHHVRRINGKRFDFSRIRWADGSVTVKVTPYNRTDVLHQWDWKADGTPFIVSQAAEQDSCTCMEGGELDCYEHGRN